jgi:transcriptional regulator GlxA family with amidase domain
MDTTTITVGIFVFDDVELLDFAGPYEVFTTAAHLHEEGHPFAAPMFEVSTISATGGPVRSRAGLRCSADHDFSIHPTIDVLLVPGGRGTRELAEPEAVTRWIAAVAALSRITASVCTGAFLLAEAGLLDGLSATTHWEDVGELGSRWPSVKVVEGVRWVDEGAIVTAAGISAGIDMSLHLVERLASRDLALRTARVMEYDWIERA